MTNENYNGWTNFPTWNVALWMGNEEGSQEYYAQLARELYSDASDDETFTRLENAALILASQLKDQFEENAPELVGCYADLLNAALSEVNWREIAENILSEVDKGN
jgi:hypothetical protein